MKVLISNDDGYQADGIKTLTKAIAEVAEVIVIAPSTNKSAASSSLTINEPLEPIKIKENIYAIDATPSDCVHLALCGFLKEDIDLVITGINSGANLGDDVIYSGTVAGAIEGRFLGLPSIAISITNFEAKYFTTAAKIAKKLVKNIKKANLSHDTILNVNVPDIPYNEIKGIQITRLGKRHASEPAIVDKNNSNLYWIGDNGEEADNDVGTDFYAIKNNFVSITPLQIDLTKYNEIDAVSHWINSF